MTERLHVYIDESGTPSSSRKASDHFVISAVAVRGRNQSLLDDWLLRAKQHLNRRPEHELTWKQLKRHHREPACELLGEMTFARVISVVVCKRHLTSPRRMDDDSAYLYALRFLLERVSWLARECEIQSDLTIAHRIRFKREKLTLYQERLLAIDTQIAWQHIDFASADISTPKRMTRLQIADLAASATAASFEPDASGIPHPEYVQAFKDILWIRPPGKLTSYGLKMHPWSESTKAAYPWVAAL